MPGMNPGQQNPLIMKFSQHQIMQDGSNQVVENTIHVNTLDQSPEVNQKVK